MTALDFSTLADLFDSDTALIVETTLTPEAGACTIVYPGWRLRGSLLVWEEGGRRRALNVAYVVSVSERIES